MLNNSLKRLWLISLAVLALFAMAPARAQAAEVPTALPQKLAELEKSFGGRLGVVLLGPQGERLAAYRADERFPLCSTFKVVLAGAVLQRSAADPAFLDKRVAYSAGDLVSWSPVTEKNIPGLTVFALCAAALQHSDNTAANLLMRELGGPAAVTAFARSLGDAVFTLDRWETELNSAIPGDGRDTTSPAAMAATLHKLALGGALPPRQQSQLQEWLKGNSTGEESLRAGLPDNWTVGDKTGSGAYGVTNDIAVIWRPFGPPLTLAAYLTQTETDAAPRKDILAAVARLIVEELGLTGRACGRYYRREIARQPGPEAGSAYASAVRRPPVRPAGGPLGPVSRQYFYKSQLPVIHAAGLAPAQMPVKAGGTDSFFRAGTKPGLGQAMLHEAGLQRFQEGAAQAFPFMFRADEQREHIARGDPGQPEGGNFSADQSQQRKIVAARKHLAHRGLGYAQRGQFRAGQMIFFDGATHVENGRHIFRPRRS